VVRPSPRADKTGVAEPIHERCELILVGDLQQFGVFEHGRPMTRGTKKKSPTLKIFSGWSTYSTRTLPE
jgi:hypothetical protein